MRSLTIALALSGSLFAGTIDPRVSDRKHLDYGEQFKCVLRISCREKDTNLQAWASCVAVSPRCVITAAHVVDGCEDWAVHVSGTSIKLSRVVVHADFEDGHDIAIGHTESDLGLDFYPLLYGHDDEVGKVASICGYGIAGTFDSGGYLSDGLRRAGSNYVDEVDSRGLLVCSVGRGRRTSLEFLIAPGDSGGGLFIDQSLAGINSIVMSQKGSPRSRWNDESGHTRISTHKAWIDEQINK